tara:strand:- start:8860 stop:9225 length:366 start_codon:yes stop_codon:yes gene_type:complete
MAIWTPVDREALGAIADATTSADKTINCSGVAITSGELRGLVVTTSASNGAGHAAKVKVYSEAAKTNLLYEVDISLAAGTSGSDTISPIPLFEAATYTLTTSGAGGGTKDYWVRFFIKATD